jgi:hypothetical protein
MGGCMRSQAIIWIDIICVRNPSAGMILRNEEGIEIVKNADQTRLFFTNCKKGRTSTWFSAKLAFQLNM